MTVGLVLVSHSRELANGLADVAAQMAPAVTIAPAGGLEDGGIGTSFELITAAIEKADTGAGAILLYDLGSGFLTAETALEFLEPDQASGSSSSTPRSSLVRYPRPSRRKPVAICGP